MKKIILLFIGLLLIPSFLFAGSLQDMHKAVARQRVASGGGITFDAESNSHDTTNHTLTFSHTVGTGSNRFLIVVAGGHTIDAGDITGVTYNGTSMTAWWDKSGASTYNSSGWYLVDPDSGANNVIITASSSKDLIIGCASSFTGVHQTTPVGTAAEGSAFSATPTIDVTAVVGDLVIDGLFLVGSDGAADASQSEISGHISSGYQLGISTETAASTTVTMSWTMTSAWWALGGGAIKPAE